MNKRIYYVDWLRVMVILSLIPYHAALTYTGLGEIYIKQVTTGIRLIPFIFVTMPLDNFFMTLLFFLAGISSYYSLRSRKKEAYIKERLKKLLVPFLIGTIFLSPIQAYFKGLYYGFNGTIIDFIPEFFSKKIVDYLGYAHLWFLLYLLVFSLICYPLFIKLIENKSTLLKVTDFVINKKNIYLPILWIIIMEVLLRPYFPGMQTLIMDWANDLIYISVYIFGFCYASDKRIQEKVDLLFSKSVIISLISLVVLFAIYYYWLLCNGDSSTITMLWAFTKGVYECFMIIMLLGLGRRYFNMKSDLLNYLSKASFTYYIIHLLPVTIITFFVINTDMNDYFKYFITVILSFVLVEITYEVIRNMKKVLHRC